MKKILFYIFSLIVVLLGLTFAFLNAEPVAINYYISTNEIPLSLLLVIAFSMGGVVGLLVGLLKRRKKKRKNNDKL